MIRSLQRTVIGDVNEESREIPWMRNVRFQRHVVGRQALILCRDRSILERRCTFSLTRVIPPNIHRV